MAEALGGVGGQVKDVLDAVLGEDAAEQIRIEDGALIEANARRHVFAEAA